MVPLSMREMPKQVRGKLSPSPGLGYIYVMQIFKPVTNITFEPLPEVRLSMSSMYAKCVNFVHE